MKTFSSWKWKYNIRKIGSHTSLETLLINDGYRKSSGLEERTGMRWEGELYLLRPLENPERLSVLVLAHLVCPEERAIKWVCLGLQEATEAEFFDTSLPKQRSTKTKIPQDKNGIMQWNWQIFVILERIQHCSTSQISSHHLTAVRVHLVSCEIIRLSERSTAGL